MKYHGIWKKARWPIDLAAWMTGVARRRRPYYWMGVYWTFCCHRSHRKARRCWRWFQYDGYCAKHNRSCYSSCKTSDAA